jgi:hypothetical protein
MRNRRLFELRQQRQPLCCVQKEPQGDSRGQDQSQKKDDAVLVHLGFLSAYWWGIRWFPPYEF